MSKKESKNTISRRGFLRGSSAVIGLPMLNAMIPNVAKSQNANFPYRFVTAFCGNHTAGSVWPNQYGSLSAALPASIMSLEPVKSNISIVSNIGFPRHARDAQPTQPGSAIRVNHTCTLSPALSGVSSERGVPILMRGTSCDQIAAQFLGRGAVTDALHVRVQAARYNNTNQHLQEISAVRNGNNIAANHPEVSPLRVYDMLFSGANGGGTPGQPQPSFNLARKKSVLDLVMDDAKRLVAAVGSEDKQTLESHFQKIREMEEGLSTMALNPPPTITCATPTRPGPDPAIQSLSFGGWANETLRGQVHVDLIAHALACDLTRVATILLTYPQPFIRSVAGGESFHEDGHKGTNIQKAANANWSASMVSRLIQNLQNRPEGGGTVLDKTFISFFFGQGTSAHSAGVGQIFYITAGIPSRIRSGQHVNGLGGHPAQVNIAGLQAIGMNTNQLGEITTGATPGLKV